VQQPGLWCDSCKEGIINGEDQKQTREELQAFKARIDGLLEPEEIYKIRKKILRLTQKEASTIFGGGPNAFSRYENGEMSPSRALSGLLRILKHHPEQLKEVQIHSARTF
jgi:HTH-type transcriptional regulator/antitoxin MqsA